MVFLTIYLRRYLLLVSGLLVCTLGLYSQQLSFEQTELKTVFEQIEQNSNLSFNYEATRIDSCFFTGQIELHSPSDMMDQLLKNTALDYQISQNYILIFTAVEQMFEICGYVKSPDDSPIAFASIQIGTQGLSSDENGYFSCRISALKNQKIAIHHLGYSSYESTLHAIHNTACAEIILKPTTYQLGLNLVVTDYLLNGINEGQELGATSFHYPQVMKTYPFQEYDLLKTIQLLPGINSHTESASDFNIRGSLSDQNLVLWEGVNLYDPGHIFGQISSISPFIIHKIDVYKSVYSPQYDHRIGGIIELSLNDSIPQDYTAGIGLTLTETHAYSELPLIKNKLALILSGRFTSNSFFKSPTLNNYAEKIFQTNIIGEEDNSTALGFNNSNENLNFQDWNAKMLYKLSDRISVETAYFRSKNKFDYFANAVADDLENSSSVAFDSEAINSHIDIQWVQDFKTKFFFKQSLYDNENQSLLSNNSETGFSYQSNSSNNIKDQQIGLLSQWHYRPSLSLEFGYTHKKQHITYSLNQNSISENPIIAIQNNKGNFHDIHINSQYQKGLFSFMGGIKNSYYQAHKSWYFSPRFQLQYLIQPTLKLKLSAGHFQQFVHQFPNATNSAINANTQLWQLNNNKNEAVLKAQKLSTGFIYNKHNWLLDVEAYYYASEGLSNKLLPVRIEQSGQAKTIGFDVLLRKNWKRYKVWLNYTLSKQQWRFTQIQADYFLANQHHPHNLSIYNSFKLKNWNFSLTYQWRSGLAFSQPSGIESYLSADEQNTYYRLQYDNINDQQLKAYSRLDFGIGYTKNIYKNKLKLESSLSILNLLDRKNVSGQSFFIGDIESSEAIKIFSLEKYLLKRTPQLMLRLYW